MSRALAAEFLPRQFGETLSYRRARQGAMRRRVNDLGSRNFNSGMAEPAGVAGVCRIAWPKSRGDSMSTTEPKSVIDTSKMSAAQREALELTESAREVAQAQNGFAGGLFFLGMGAPQSYNLCDPYFEGGMNWMGPFRGREKDTFGSINLVQRVLVQT
jgi:hypothetical protein